MKICVPSSNRAKNTKTQKVLSTCIFFVPENQYDEYKKSLVQEIIPVPNEFYGITKTRNFILNYFKGENIIFVDDDLKECGFFKAGQRFDFRKDNYEPVLLKEFNRCFELCDGLGFKIWGCEAGGSRFANHPLTPFSFKSVINGSFLGIINDGEYLFDEIYEVKEDYEIVLRHYKRKGGILKVRHFFWRSTHWKNTGGCVDYRTDEMEEKCIDMLRKQFGGMISTGKAKNKFQISIKWV